MELVLATQYQIYFVFSHSWDVEKLLVSSLASYWFGQHMLFPRKHGRALVNTCSDAFCVFAGMGRVWLLHVEIHFGMGCVNTC